MNMFASDLDRTLIFSKRALSEFMQLETDQLVGVERKENLYTAFMTIRSLQALRIIKDHMLFVPVTTRTSDQFKRIFIFSKEIPLKYAVTSNGANIIYKGNPLLEWRRLIEKRLHEECTGLKEMIHAATAFQLDGTIRIAEDLFFYFILNQEGLDRDKVNQIRSEASTLGWNVSLQGKKLYFMPKPISKGDAVEFIRTREGITSVYGAGDSLLDLDFLNTCHVSFIPSHGELSNEIVNENPFKITKNRGVMAGEEILLEILKETKCFV